LTIHPVLLLLPGLANEAADPDDGNGNWRRLEINAIMWWQWIEGI
jgi:hypothetical protein